MREAILAAGHELLGALPEAHRGVTQSERNRFLTTVDRLLEADLLVADVSRESAAVGWGVAWFLARGRLVVLCCRRDARAHMSPMLAGNPSPWSRLVLYDQPADLASHLADQLRG